MGLVLDSFVCPLSCTSLTGWHVIISGNDRYMVVLHALTLYLISYTVMLGFLLLRSAQEITWLCELLSWWQLQGVQVMSALCMMPSLVLSLNIF